MIDWYLPGTRAGGPVRSIHSWCEAMKDVYDICVFTSNKDLGSEEAYENMVSDTYVDLNGIRVFYFSHLSAGAILAELKKFSPHLIYLNSFWSYPFSISLVKAKKSGVLQAPLVLAPRGMLGTGAMSLKPFKKKFFLMLAKLSGWYNGITFLATNEQERADIIRHFGHAEIIGAPNLNTGIPMPAARKKTKGNVSLFFLSRVARVKNLHFALEILGNIPADINVEYDIFGNNEDAAYWGECEKIAAKLPKNIHVQYKGELRFEEVQQVICRYHALLLPTLNENFGHSIVEALLSGCIVITSDQTPWSDMRPGYAIALKDREKFADAVKEIASWDQHEFDSRSIAAISYISSKLDLEKSKELYRIAFDGKIKN